MKRTQRYNLCKWIEIISIFISTVTSKVIRENTWSVYLCNVGILVLNVWPQSPIINADVKVISCLKISFGKLVIYRVQCIVPQRGDWRKRRIKKCFQKLFPCNLLETRILCFAKFMPLHGTFWPQIFVKFWFFFFW